MNTSNATYGTYTISNNGFVLGMGEGTKPAETPKGLIVTRCVQTKRGWVGQVIVDKDIVLESSVFEDYDEAGKWANEQVVSRIKRLFLK